MSDVRNTVKKSAGETSFLYGDLTSGAKESFKRLRTNVTFSFDNEGSHVVGLTSACASEGKSLVTINLCCALSEIGKKVILLDGDVYRPSIHQKLKLSSSRGLSEMTKPGSNYTVAVQHFTGTGGTGFDFIASGEPAEDPAEVLNNKGLNRLVSKLREEYDYVVIDMPPIGSVADVSALASLTDGLLFVVHEGHTPRVLLRECIEQLSYSKARVLGFVLNGSTSGTITGYGYGKGYGYTKSYSYDYTKSK